MLEFAHNKKMENGFGNGEMRELKADYVAESALPPIEDPSFEVLYCCFTTAVLLLYYYFISTSPR